MEILAFVCLTGAMWLLGLAMVMGLRLDFRRYTGYSLVFAAVGLGIFEWGSVGLGLVQFGEAYSVSIPEDYIERGVSGLLLIFEGVLAVFSPFLAAFAVSLRSPRHL